MSATIEDLEKLSLRVGKIIAAERISGMTKIFKVQVDTGNGTAQAIAGGAEFYQPESLVGKPVIIATNMVTKTIKGIKSEVMLLAADLNGKPLWLTVDSDAPPGTKVR